MSISYFFVAYVKCGLYDKLEIRSVERGICPIPIATSTMNELLL